MRELRTEFNKYKMDERDYKAMNKKAQDGQCDIYVVSTRFSTRSFIIGCGCGMTLGLMLAIIIINVC